MEDLWIHPKAQRLDIARTCSTVILPDDSLLTVDGSNVCVSRDDGRTWETGPMFPGSSASASWEYALLRTAEGVIVGVYMDLSTKKWGWDNEMHQPIPDARLEVWSTRSTDNGRTWSPPQRLSDGWCGAIINIIQTRTGRIVVPVQRLLHDPGRHGQATYVSDDLGLTWRRSNMIDFGGHGHHDGTCEGVLLERRDGRLWMLLRTNMDRFWQAFSEDQGLTWRTLLPTDIDASSAPAYLARLRSGLVAMAWNRFYPEGLSAEEKARFPLRGGDRNLSERATSWYRGEVSLALSEDDGQTWTRPQVVMRCASRGLSYPFILERRPGLLWLMTRFNYRVAITLREQEFVGPASAPPWA